MIVKISRTFVWSSNIHYWCLFALWLSDGGSAGLAAGYAQHKQWLEKTRENSRDIQCLINIIRSKSEVKMTKYSSKGRKCVTSINYELYIDICISVCIYIHLDVWIIVIKGLIAIRSQYFLRQLCCGGWIHTAVWLFNVCCVMFDESSAQLPTSRQSWPELQVL